MKVMEFSDGLKVEIVTIFALVYGPLVAAFWLSSRAKAAAEKSENIAVFRTLWANRSHADHSTLLRFESINLVPVVFHGDKKIHKCWSLYIDAVRVLPWDDTAIENAQKVYLNLLKSIANYLKYKFSPDDLNRGYYPTANEIIFEEEQMIRKGLVKLLSNGQPLPIAVKEFPQPDDS